jgi:hypothetical protein
VLITCWNKCKRDTESRKEITVVFIAGKTMLIYTGELVLSQGVRPLGRNCRCSLLDNSKGPGRSLSHSCKSLLGSSSSRACLPRAGQLLQAPRYHIPALCSCGPGPPPVLVCFLLLCLSKFLRSLDRSFHLPRSTSCPAVSMAAVLICLQQQQRT